MGCLQYSWEKSRINGLNFNLDSWKLRSSECRSLSWGFWTVFRKIFPGGSAGKACNVGDSGSIIGFGRAPGEGNGYPLQYSGQENSMEYSPWGCRVGHSWATFTLLFTYLAVLGLSCGTQDLVPWSGIEPRFPALGVQSLSLWATKEVLKFMNIYGGKKARKPSLKKYTAIPSHWLIGALIRDTTLQILTHHRLFWRFPRVQKPTCINNNHLALSEKDWRSWQRKRPLVTHLPPPPPFSTSHWKFILYMSSCLLDTKES